MNESRVLCYNSGLLSVYTRKVSKDACCIHTKLFFLRRDKPYFFIVCLDRNFFEHWRNPSGDLLIFFCIKVVDISLHLYIYDSTFTVLDWNHIRIGCFLLLFWLDAAGCFWQSVTFCLSEVYEKNMSRKHLIKKRKWLHIFMKRIRCEFGSVKQCKYGLCYAVKCFMWTQYLNHCCWRSTCIH